MDIWNTRRKDGDVRGLAEERVVRRAGRSDAGRHHAGHVAWFCSVIPPHLVPVITRANACSIPFLSCRTVYMSPSALLPPLW